jgi:hypothetical protein
VRALALQKMLQRVKLFVGSVLKNKNGNANRIKSSIYALKQHVSCWGPEISILYFLMISSQTWHSIKNKLRKVNRKSLEQLIEIEKSACPDDCSANLVAKKVENYGGRVGICTHCSSATARARIRSVHWEQKQ